MCERGQGRRERGKDTRLFLQYLLKCRNNTMGGGGGSGRWGDHSLGTGGEVRGSGTTSYSSPCSLLAKPIHRTTSTPRGTMRGGGKKKASSSSSSGSRDQTMGLMSLGCGHAR